MLEREVTANDIMSWLDAGREASSRRRWVVDPIDGTKGFIRGDQFAVAVALLVDGEPVVGALACPLLPFGYNGATEARGIVATAVKGQGAIIEPLLSEGPVMPMQVSDRTDAASARIVESVETGHTDHAVSSAILKTAGVGGQPVRMDSQAKYAAVADGRAEIYLRLQRGDYRERIWDHAAGALLVQEAGGIVTDLDGKPLDFSLGQTLEDNRGILATGSQPIHQAMLKAIAQHIE
jgi:3'(2'), 5'-bisphosphate nucleotidase